MRLGGKENAGRGLLQRDAEPGLCMTFLAVEYHEWCVTEGERERERERVREREKEKRGSERMKEKV